MIQCELHGEVKAHPAVWTRPLYFCIVVFEDKFKVVLLKKKTWLNPLVSHVKKHSIVHKHLTRF